MPSIVVFDPEDESGLAYLGKIFSGENTKVSLISIDNASLSAAGHFLWYNI